MNWYDHHLRGYDADTAHLTWDQDMAYTRLLRWYYRKEEPIPLDIEEACRQIRATEHQEAVQKVLAEFFVRRPDGWHRADVDAALERYQAGEPEREAKRTNEFARLARHRGERTALFHVINGAGLHRPWNSPIAQLRELARKLQGEPEEEPEEEPEGPESDTCNASNAPATPPATLQALSPEAPLGDKEPATLDRTCNAPATANSTNPTSTPNSIPTPISISNSSSIPNSISMEGVKTHTGAQESEIGPSAPAGQTTASGDADQGKRVLQSSAICMALQAEGIGECNPGHPKLVELLEAGAQLQNFVAAAEQAKKARHPFAYVLGTVEGQLEEARAIARHGKARINGHAGKSERAARMAQFSPSLAGAAADAPADTEARDVPP